MCHGTRIPIPWYPYPYTHGTPCLLPTYIHALIHLFYLFIYLSYCLCLSYYLYLSYSSLLSCSVSSRSLLALGKACPWAEAAGLVSLMCANVLFLFNYYPVVHMYGMVCMYSHVLYSVCVYIIYYVCIQQMYVCT